MTKVLILAGSEPPALTMALMGSLNRDDLAICQAPRGMEPPFILHDEMAFYLHDRPRPSRRRACYDESGPWPPVAVDPIVAKHRDIRIAKAEIKRAKKKLKRLGLKAFPMTGPGYDQAKLFLAAIGQLEKFESNGQSVDGYSLVAWANAELEKVKS